MPNDLFGLVLAGGKSSRMGFDKAQLNFHGEPQLSFLKKLLEKLCAEVFVSIGQREQDCGLNIIPDSFETGGPLNGILSADKLQPGKAWLVVPVDMPNLTIESLTFFIAKRNQKKLATYFLNGNQIETLPVILEKEALSVLHQNFLAGETSLHRFLKIVETEPVICPDLTWLMNVNEPGQLPESK